MGPNMKHSTMECLAKTFVLRLSRNTYLKSQHAGRIEEVEMMVQRTHQ